VIVLDTHAWIWWATESRKLSKKAARRIRGASALGVSAISVWEVATLVARGRLRLDRDVEEWVGQALSLPQVELLPLSAVVAIRSTQLGSGFHSDPADQIIVATALVLDAPIVTSDQRIQSFEHVGWIW
jgi:PIN domain nuclease of toxin-antitoxin system